MFWVCEANSAPQAGAPSRRTTLAHRLWCPDDPALETIGADGCVHAGCDAGGAVAGYQYGINAHSPLRNPYNLGVFIRPANDAIAVHWNQFAYPVRTAVTGTMVVQEADRTHTIDLSQPELRNGQMLYRTQSSNANFRLEVALPDSRTVSETVSWQR